LAGALSANPGAGFVYKRVPHITLKSIANQETPEQETLYDQPEIDKGKVRVSGPFTVEAVPAPVVFPIKDNPRLAQQIAAAEAGENPFEEAPEPGKPRAENHGKKLADWIGELRSSGILGRAGERITFARVEPLSAGRFLHAEAETPDNPPRRALLSFASETNPLDARAVDLALVEASDYYPRPEFIIFSYFQIDPQASSLIEKAKLPGVTILKVQMNVDLMTADLKKKVSGSQSFWLVGQPDVELLRLDEPAQDSSSADSFQTYKIRVLGFDYYDVKRRVVESAGSDRIAMWMLDPDYDGMAIAPTQVFFPMEGKGEGWDKLARTLRAEIDPALIEQYRGVESLPFAAKANSLIAVKIVDDRGIESLKVLPLLKEN
jgi:adenine-specific DNA-methyltransferase